MNYYRVTAKCGHVGKRAYYLGNFYVKAKTASAAALWVRWLPRVKHHHWDAIRSVSEIDVWAYRAGLLETNENPYFKCHSKQDQRIAFPYIEMSLYPETPAPLYMKSSPAKRNALFYIKACEKRINTGQRNFKFKGDKSYAICKAAKSESVKQGTESPFDARLYRRIQSPHS
jgi:hypothetical protein